MVQRADRERASSLGLRAPHPTRCVVARAARADLGAAHVHGGVVSTDESRRILVCDKCLMASCWSYVFPCDYAQHAGTTTRTIAELRELDREHPSYWERPEVQRAG